ncbi:MAG: Re/Si-specific NAD(P)(+) transhydrogenase subunit alpha [Gammaproteobacteria bacterium]|nr:Re/Si-specific NAD(P)(+) transhydrogenase subunit alpha [Gammaproteobacteria bacterium]NNF61694.1 Re/Si-specific NAD(P)(+) transhydrogenase subunit alpha [Gammaproteobacteria bacterium]NNM20324.1 Re/Si-specific NAD(P)(+) transhydrogenase subunit alpha [Gammaproteobacteria bacterium]
MKIGVPREVHPGEQRVATTPEVVPRLLKLGYQVGVETGAGAAAAFSDAAYREAGATILPDPKTLWSQSDIVLKVRAPGQHPLLEVHEAELLQPGAILASFVWPAQNPELMEQLSQRGASVLAMDSVPRISRAQKLDALSSMANIAGYRAVVEASWHFGRFFTGQVTAAGKVPPARVMVIGAGVAGLAAIGAAGSLGAIVRAFDTRPEVKEQVQSMGAEFLELDFDEEGSGSGGYAKVMSEEFIAAEMALFREQAREIDIIVTTALIPGKPSPKLILTDMVELMREGSVIVDLAAEQGGNCELTRPGEVVTEHGVTIIGYTDLPSRLPTQSSQLYSTNLYNLLAEMTPEKDGIAVVDMEDEVIRGTTVVHDGEVTWPPPPPKLSAQPQKPSAAAVEAARPAAPDPRKRSLITMGVLGGTLAALLALGSVAPASFMAHLTVFVLAVFVGWQVIWSVTPALHTPLMSVTNAISGIIVIGALLQIGGNAPWVVILSFVAVLIASINIAGGFLVTQRMLTMFRREDSK